MPKAGEILLAYLRLFFDAFVIFIVIRRFISLSNDPRIIGAIIFFAALFGMNSLSKFFGLPATFWLSGKFIEYFLIILIILFQPEIRRMILGWRLDIFREDVNERILEEILESTRTLSARKEGGIIVIERSVDTRTFIQDGKVVDADVSAELISAIFNKYSQTHDGAIIIKGSKIHMISAILPISTKETPGFGMRHRAGLGITEETDAVSVIISDNGKISLAYSGQMIHDIDVEALRKKLYEIFKVKTKKK
ncbi:MAG: diadenylate cyclase [bacterium]|nr:diadenylate cyclase [bacterium]